MDPVSFVELAKLIGNYGVGVVCLATLIALHIYNIRVTIPNMTEAASKQIDGLVAAFREEMRETRTQFAAELDAERLQCHQDHEKLLVTLEAGNRQLTADQQLVQLALTRLLERVGVPSK